MRSISIEQWKKEKVWVGYDTRPDDTGEMREKTPVNAKTNGNAATNKENTWAIYAEVEKAIKEYSLKGAGFVLKREGVCGIDLDTHKNGKLTKESLEILELFKGKTYIELSPNKGYHIVFLADMMKIPEYKDAAGKRLYLMKNAEIDAELYFSGRTNRYLTYTGNSIDGTDKITDCTSLALKVLQKYFRICEKKATHLQGDAILDAIRKSKQAETFKALYDNGDLSDYAGDDSRADQALCNILAWWYGGDPDKVDQLFRQSALYRDKWERQDYRDATIQKAIDACDDNFYDPSEKRSGSSKKERLTIDRLESYLEENNITLRKNVLSNEIIYTGFSNVYDPESLTEDAAVILLDQLKDEYKITKGDICDFLKVISGKEGHRFNPVVDLLSTYTWDGSDHLSQLFRILELSPDDTLSRVLVKKWLIQARVLVENDISDPFGAEGVLVLCGEQGAGKSYLARKLALKPTFFKDGAHIDPKNKDLIIENTSVWICELGEIESTMKSEVELLKAFLTQSKDTVRVPFGRSAETHSRKTSYIGTCNSKRFLLDLSGNRRFWTISVPDRMDKDAIDQLDAIQLWKQVEHFIQTDGKQSFRLTPEEMNQLKERNQKYMKPVKAQVEVEDILQQAESNPNLYEKKFITATAFKECYGELSKYPAQVIGTALAACGIEPITHRLEVNGKSEPRRGYWLPVRKPAYPNYGRKTS